MEFSDSDSDSDSDFELTHSDSDSDSDSDSESEQVVDQMENSTDSESDSESESEQMADQMENYNALEPREDYFQKLPVELKTKIISFLNLSFKKKLELRSVCKYFAEPVAMAVTDITIPSSVNYSTAHSLLERLSTRENRIRKLIYKGRETAFIVQLLTDFRVSGLEIAFDNFFSFSVIKRNGPLPALLDLTMSFVGYILHMEDLKSFAPNLEKLSIEIGWDATATCNGTAVLSKLTSLKIDGLNFCDRAKAVLPTVLRATPYIKYLHTCVDRVGDVSGSLASLERLEYLSLIVGWIGSQKDSAPIISRSLKVLDFECKTYNIGAELLVENVPKLCRLSVQGYGSMSLLKNDNFRTQVKTLVGEYLIIGNNMDFDVTNFCGCYPNIEELSMKDTDISIECLLKICNKISRLKTIECRSIVEDRREWTRKGDEFNKIVATSLRNIYVESVYSSALLKLMRDNGINVFVREDDFGMLLQYLPGV